MNKLEFLKKLENELSGLPKNDIEERLNFYSEIIDDKIDDGYSEEAAISEIGSTGEVASQIIAEFPISKLVKEKISSKKRLGALEIILLVLGSPIWLSLMISAIAVIISLYVSLWSVIISLWSVFVALIGCAVGCSLGGIILAFTGFGLTGILAIGSGLFCGGLSIFMFYGCKLVTKGILLLTKKIAISIKNSFIRKEKAE